MNLRLLPHYRQMLAGHELVPHERGPTITAYYLSKPGHGRQCSTMILFTPEAIVLLGDLTPQNHGSVSCRGYGEAWFAGRLSPDYLAEKFLRERFVPELARDRLRDRQWWADVQGVTDPRRLDAIAALVADVDALDGPSLHLRLSEAAGDHLEYDAVPGWGYDPNELSLLVAIQERFAVLYHGDAPAPQAGRGVPA